MGWDPPSLNSQREVVHYERGLPGAVLRGGEIDLNSLTLIGRKIEGLLRVAGRFIEVRVGCQRRQNRPRRIADLNLEISTEESYAMARHLSRNAGLLVGISSAAAAVGCLNIARELRLKRGQEAVMVTILCDSGEKYLSERFWTE